MNIHDIECQICDTPRVHGNGFIQVPLTGNRRLHIWHHPDCPSQKTYTGIHDHRFSFESKVLRGRLSNHIWKEAYPGRPVQVYTPNADGSLVLLHNEGPCDDPVTTTLRCDEYHIRTQGQTYYQRRKEIHEVRADPMTVTLMQKTFTDDYYVPRVFCPEGEEPDNDMKQPDLDDIWRWIREALK